MISEGKRLFDGWDKGLIWSCLQGHMGSIFVSNEPTPKSAIIDIGDFCFLAGEPNTHMLDSLRGFKLLIPRDPSWETVIEDFFGKKVNKILRYALKKEPDVFDLAALTAYVMSLDDCYELRLFDQTIFQLAQKESWSMDLCSQFRDFSDYQNRAIGVAILHGEKLVAGASPYATYDNGIEIDTNPEYRWKGLATVCGAKLILECLERKIYPSWDAHDLRSVRLAEKLGYHLSHPYVTYELSE